jgi:hypothetical protein
MKTDWTEDLPQDVAAVRAHQNAYAMVGDTKRANQCVRRLARIALEQSDVEEARRVLTEMRFSEPDDQVIQLITELERLVAKTQ